MIPFFQNDVEFGRTKMRFKGESPLDDDLSLVLIKRDPILTHKQHV